MLLYKYVIIFRDFFIISYNFEIICCSNEILLYNFVILCYDFVTKKNGNKLLQNGSGVCRIDLRIGNYYNWSTGLIITLFVKKQGKTNSTPYDAEFVSVKDLRLKGMS